MLLNDTIAAISTPLGEGGIGIIRLSGKDSIKIAEKVFFSSTSKKLSELKSHSIIYGFIIDTDTGTKLDEVLCTVMKAPKTYTREDIVEINCHGGMLPVTNILALLIKNGARLAEPGEFTKRAFLNGRIDLSQAEAVIDLIRSKTYKSEKIAMQQLEGRLSKHIKEIMDEIIGLCVHLEAFIDFPDEEIDIIPNDEIIQLVKNLIIKLQRLSASYEEGRYFKEGVSTAIIGKPNVGKSSLLNALLQKDRAIVTPSPGTTRDVIEDYINIKGLPLRILDTAGIRESDDIAEKEGVKRTLRAIDNSDIIIALLDCSIRIEDIDKEIFSMIKDKKSLIVINKIDIESPLFRIEDLGKPYDNFIKISALNGIGIDELKDKIYSLCITLNESDLTEGYLISNVRHKDSIDKAIRSLNEATVLIQNGEMPEIVALVIRESANFLGEIIGVVTTDEILDRIFNEFCIGK